MTRPRAVVSIGTNSTRLLILDGDVEAAKESRGTRLGAGLRAAGPLDSEARERTLVAIRDYAEVVRARDASVSCIATSAMRRASDGEAFAADVEALLETRPQILSGPQEATYSFLGATRRNAASGRIGVLDVGGGSTELAVDVPAHARRTARVGYARSLEIGAVRLAERHPELLGAAALETHPRQAVENAARLDAAAVLAPLGEAGPLPALIAVGGTAFTAAAMLAQQPRYDGVRLTTAGRAELIEALLTRDLEERKALPLIRPQRADILPAGLIVIDEACRLLGVEDAVVSEEDLLSGWLRFGPESANQ